MDLGAHFLAFGFCLSLLHLHLWVMGTWLHSLSYKGQEARKYTGLVVMTVTRTMGLLEVYGAIILVSNK